MDGKANFVGFEKRLDKDLQKLISLFVCSIDDTRRSSEIFSSFFQVLNRNSSGFAVYFLGKVSLGLQPKKKVSNGGM